MSDIVILERPGMAGLEFTADHLPPVGTRIELDDHLCDSGTSLRLEVTAQEWELLGDVLGKDNEDQGPTFRITLRTRDVTPQH